jgi:hypothetical protein
VHTNTIEGFFGNMKNGIRGNYHAVSPKWLQGYLNEFAWRYNHRPKFDGRRCSGCSSSNAVEASTACPSRTL